MPHSDDYGLDDDDTIFLAAVTQIEASQRNTFNTSPRPTKRQRIDDGPTQIHSARFARVDRDGSADRDQSFSCTAVNDEPEEDEEYDFPEELVGPDGQKDLAAKQSKYKIHVPKNAEQFKDQIFTQTQVDLDEDPSHFRGAIWKRPEPPPPPVFGQRSTNVPGGRPNVNVGARPLGPKQTSLSFGGGIIAPQSENGYRNDASLAARLQAQENAQHRQRQRSAGVSRPALALPPAFDVSQALADLPSDAFSSSSPERSQEGVIIEIHSQQPPMQARPPAMRGPQQGLKQMNIFGQPATQPLSTSQAAKKKHAWPLKEKDEKPTHHKLDDEAIKTWVYPTNLGTIRDYQYSIVTRSLFHNTLVALPTGLGKTFIAATVMLNYYRWTKDAQIVFMAPTKPLIAQQMEACFNIVGIPRRDTVLMTGETTPALRAEEWLEKRVFFMTPQTVSNDLKTGICDPKKLVLAVVDEAHKATGGYAYTEVVKFLARFNPSFRVLALTATPGSKVEQVQGVIDNLSIARVELRTELSLDIRQYTHEKHTDTELFDYSDEQNLIMEHMSKALKPVLDKLCSQNAYWQRDPMALTAYGLTIARQKYMQSDAGRKAPPAIKGMVNSVFTVLSSLAHGISLLKFHGIGPFYSNVREFQKNVDSGQSKGKYAAQIAQSEDFTKMTSFIRTWTADPDFIGHPKLQYLREVVLNHFLDTGEGLQGPNVPPSATRVMVFTSYRDSTEAICRVLKRNEPMIRPHVFVGQAASKESEGMDQKRQNTVIQDFKSGKYNTLVATSIGEEGLDIGDVDLIVCYDASASPIRMLQRIGRTGRKRVGRVVLLLMRGKEENDYAKAQDNYAFIQRTIADENKYNYHDDKSPRILPKDVRPVVDKRVIDIPLENSQPVDLNEKGRKAKGKGRGKAKRPPKKFHMPDGVRTGFVSASRMGSDGDDDSDQEGPPKKTVATKTKPMPAKAKKLQASKEPEQAQLPFLEDVLLNGAQQRELERKYAHTADEDADVVIRAPDPTRYPERLATLGASKDVPHGRATRAVAIAMQNMKGCSDAKVARMKAYGHPGDLFTSLGDARTRLIVPQSIGAGSDDDLPDNPLIAPVARKPVRGRPKKNQTAQKTPSSVVDNSQDLPAPPAKKPRGRPRKQCARSYGSAAEEGDSSSPEPTPAHLRIGTQGIDLGSRDTSGEEDDEQPDSELDGFIVKSDQPIEMASSSLRLPDDTQPRRAAGCRKAPEHNAMLFSEDEGMESDPALLGMATMSDDDSDDVQEIAAPVPVAKAPARKKRKVVVDDSDE